LTLSIYSGFKSPKKRVDGLTTQKVIINYNCIGAFKVPDWENITDFDIAIETRKGVALCYSA